MHWYRVYFVIFISTDRYKIINQSSRNLLSVYNYKFEVL